MELFTHLTRIFIFYLLATALAATTAAAAAATTTATTITTISAAIPATVATTTATIRRTVITRFFFTGSAGLGSLLSSSYCCYGQTLSLLFANDFNDRFATQQCFSLSRAQFAQSRQAGINRISGIRAAQRLGQDISDTHGLHHRAHSATSDYTSTWSSRFEHNFRSAKAGCHHKGDGCAIQRHFDQVFFRILYTFTNGFGIFSGLTQTIADMTIMITNDYERSDTETAPAFDNLGDTAHLHHCLIQV
jgi:hypothetical protein